MISDVSIDSKGNPNLEQLLLDARREQAYCQFSNGCSIWFKDDDGVFWGSTPYGQDFAVNAIDWLDTVTNILNFWNDDRDENGHIRN